LRVYFGQTHRATVLLVLSILCTTLLFGFLTSRFESLHLLVAVTALAIFTIAFVKSEIALYILIFSMLLSPEIMVGGMEGGTAASRGVTLRFDDFLLAIIGFGWFARAAIHKDLGLFLRTPLNKPIFYYLLACVVATGFGIMGERVNAKTGFFFVVKYFEYFIVYFMVINQIENKEQVKKYMFCILVTCFIISLYGMLQIPAGGRLTAPFEGTRGEPNSLGGYLIFVGAVAAGMFSRAETLKARVILGALVMAVLLPYLYTESRSSYVAFVPAYIALALMCRRRGLMIGLLLIALILSPILLPSNVKERIVYTFTQPEQRGQIVIGDTRIDTSASARIKSWKEGLENVPKHPIIGYGVTGYAFMDAQYLRVLVETGILGFAAFVYLLYSIFKISFLMVRKIQDKYFEGIAVGFLAGYIGLVFHAIGANTFIIVRIMEPFWFVLAMVVMLPTLEAEETGTEQGAKSSIGHGIASNQLN
jgi:O-antigen ligase